MGSHGRFLRGVRVGRKYPAAGASCTLAGFGLSRDGLRTRPSRDCESWEGMRLGREKRVKAEGTLERRGAVNSPLSEEPCNIANK